VKLNLITTILILPINRRTSSIIPVTCRFKL